MKTEKKSVTAGQETQQRIKSALDASYVQAEADFANSDVSFPGSLRLKSALEELSSKGQKASAAFTNIITCIAIKVACPTVDVRYHQVQIQSKTDRPAKFNFRGISEKIIYPWLDEKRFDGAKSGWQTRTLERPKPYKLDYDENIGDIKDAFLNVFDELEEKGASASDALQYILLLQIKNRENKKIILSVPRTQDIQLIVQVFRKHFFHEYKASRGASRLPVLALYAIYSVMKEQVARYEGTDLRALEAHSAADSQTGAVGDIEIYRISDNSVFEALEIKHDIPLSEKVVRDVITKLMSKSIDRYYILTTNANCEPDEKLQIMISNAKQLYDCQIIANGVMPSIKYYLRLLRDPSAVFKKYVELLYEDKALGHEHRKVWNDISVDKNP